MNTQEINKFLESLRRQPIDMRDMNLLLQLIKQHDYKFDKDEILEISNLVSGRMNELFVTPNKVAELISVIAEIYNPKSVIDICCGVGNILRYFKSLEIIKGLDINKSRIQWAEYINPDANFLVADALEYDFGNDKYDLVIGQPPFNARMPDRRLLDVELIKKGLTLLNDNGVAIFVVPESFLTTGGIYFEFRQEILSNFALDMVISLPTGAFLPYTSIKTSILVIRKGEKNQDVFMPEFKDNSHEIADNFKHHKGDFYLRLSKITDRLDRNYYASIETIEEIIRDHKLIKLSDVAEIISGKYLDRNSITSNGNYLIFSRKDKSFINVVPDERCVLKRDDIVVSLWNTKPDNEVFIYEDDIKMVIPQLYAIIRPSAKYKEYLKTYLQTQDWKIIVQRYVMGSVQPRLSIQDLRQIEIPLLSEDELNELVSKTLRINNENRYYIQESFKSLESEKYEEAKDNIEKAFENADSETMLHKEVYLQNIDRAEKQEEIIKELELEKKEKEKYYKIAHEKEKEMLSFFTHTMRNALATAPESLRQAIRLLGSEDYEKNQKHYEAINEITSLFSTISLVDCLIDTFKQSIYDTEEFKRAWQEDNTGNATPYWFIAAALRQSLNRIIFMEDATRLRALLANQDELIDSTRKAFIEQVLPLDVNQRQQDVTAFYQWLDSITAVEITIEPCAIQFGAQQVKFSLLFAISSELILNALKYWSGTGKIQIHWLKEAENYVFSVKNPCKASAKSRLAGTHKGLAFIKRLIELLGEQAQFNCAVENGFFCAELKLNQTLLENQNEHTVD